MMIIPIQNKSNSMKRIMSATICNCSNIIMVYSHPSKREGYIASRWEFLISMKPLTQNDGRHQSKISRSLSHSLGVNRPLTHKFHFIRRTFIPHITVHTRCNSTVQILKSKDLLGTDSFVPLYFPTILS